MITVIDQTTKDPSEGNAVASEAHNEITVAANSADNNEVPRGQIGFPMPPERLGQPPFTASAAKPPDNSDLMSRLRNFLPQMQSANRELLLTTSSGTDPVQLDTNLQAEDDSDSETDDDENETASKRNPLIQEVDSSAPEKEDDPVANKTSDETPEEVEAAPTIQLEFTVGNMTGNPLMKLLANDDDDSNDSGSDNGDENDEDRSVSARNKAVTELLAESQNPQKADKESNLVMLDSITGKSIVNDPNQRTNKKSLITEIS